MEKSTLRVKAGLAEMLKGGVIMDVISPEQAKIAEEAGAVSVMALDKVPADIRAEGGVARTAKMEIIQKIMEAVSIPVMAKCRIGHIGEAQVLEDLGIDYIDESEVLTPADNNYHLNKWELKVPVLNGCRNLGEALRRIEEGAAMLRTKGEPGTGDISEAVDHMRVLRNDIAYVAGLYELKKNIDLIGRNEDFLLREMDMESFVKIIGMKAMDSYYKEKGMIGTYIEFLDLFRKSKGKLGMDSFEDFMKINNEELLLKYKKIPSLTNELNGLFTAIKDEYGVTSSLLEYVGENKKLPIVNFAAGGIATPADAALMMMLGADGVFVGSGIFKSNNPAKFAASIVEAVTRWNDPGTVRKVSYDLGEPMKGTTSYRENKDEMMQYRST